MVAGCDVESLLAGFALGTASFEDDRKLVAAPIMYDLVEALSQASGDPYCGANLGSRRPLYAILSSNHPLAGRSLGDFLLGICVDKFTQVNSATFSLSTEGIRGVFRSIRTTHGGRIPRHVDAYGAASMIAMLRDVAGSRWDGRQVLVNLCDPEVVPRQFFGVRLAKCDNWGFSVSFPGQWLLLDVNVPENAQQVGQLPKEAAVLDETLPALRSILNTHLHEAGLDTERVAQLCGIGSRTLIRRLANKGTTLKRELDRLRRACAEEALTTSEDSISHIGARVGYPDPSVFGRAFRRWTGVTPSRFRRDASSGT